MKRRTTRIWNDDGSVEQFVVVTAGETRATMDAIEIRHAAQVEHHLCRTCAVALLRALPEALEEA